MVSFSLQSVVFCRYYVLMSMRAVVCSVLLLCGGIFCASGQQVDVRRYVDWSQRRFTFVLSTAVDPTGLPSSKQQAEGLIDRRKISSISENLASLYLDDLGPFSLPVGVKRPHLSFSLHSSVEAATKDHVTISSDMRSVQVTYQLPFSALTGGMMRSGYSYIQPVLLPHHPFEYTGIVIDATEALPVKGREPDTGHVRQALLPSLIATDGRDLVTPNSVEDAFFKKWGTVGYSFSMDDKNWPKDRVGNDPLVIPAYKILGINRTALEVSDHYADWVLSSEKGRRLLLEGRVLFLVKSDPNAVLPPAESSISPKLQRRLLN